MLENPYSKFQDTELTLRDHLAIDRTVLANERTLLSYSRTGLAVFLTGVSLIHFLENVIFNLLGGLFVPLGLAIFAVGFRRYIRTKKSLDKCLPGE